LDSVLKRTALLALVLVTAGCGSVEKAGKSEPVELHLVYEKVIGEKGIWIADIDGSHPRLLVPRGHLPAISPDGRWVTYSGECAESETSACDTLYIVSTTGADEPRRLSTVVSGTITWSPDATRIVGESIGKLLSIEVATGKAVEVAEGSFSGWSISPDGEQIVFARDEKPNGDLVSGLDVDLFVNELDGGEPKRITDTGDAADPVWGPKSIAFSRLISCLSPEAQPIDGCRNNTWARHEVWKIQPDGSGRKPITAPLPGRFQMQGCVGMRPVDWSDDGTALLAEWRCEFSDSPVAVDLQTGRTRNLVWGSDTVALSGDGLFALTQAGEGAETPPERERVLIVPYDGGKARVVAHGAVSPSWNR
jgi:Tol biopolymer transport system component